MHSTVEFSVNHTESSQRGIYTKYLKIPKISLMTMMTGSSMMMS